MHRIYHHYEKWEDYQNRMYGEIKDGRKERVLLAIECLGNKEKCYNAMKMVIENWILACEHNLTNESSNRRAWVGQAACNIAYNVKEDETREAWGILTTLAEAPETVSMIYDALTGVLKLVRDFKKQTRNLSLNTAAEAWLQYRYGIMPLIYTVKDGLEVLENLRSKNMYIDEKKKQTEIESVSILGVDVQQTTTHRVFLKRRVDISKSFSNELSINPFVTAWELVTLSFVVDWVLNVGSVLSALTTPVSWQEQKCTASIKKQATYEKDGLSIEYETYQRIIINNPTDHVKLAINPEMNRNRWFDLLALSKVILTGK